MADTKFTALTEATSLVDADLVPVVTDVATTGTTKKALWSTVVTYIISAFHAATAKASLANNDELLLMDSAASYAKKKVTWLVIWSALKTYFDTIYASLTGNVTFSGNVIATNSYFRSAAYSLNDDIAANFTPGDAFGAMLIYLSATANEYAWIVFNTGSSAATGMILGTSIVIATGALTDGTSDGTDTKFNVSASGGKIYIKNRLGSARANIKILLF